MSRGALRRTPEETQAPQRQQDTDGMEWCVHRRLEVLAVACMSAMLSHSDSICHTHMTYITFMSFVTFMSISAYMLVTCHTARDDLCHTFVQHLYMYQFSHLLLVTIMHITVTCHCHEYHCHLSLS